MECRVRVHVGLRRWVAHGPAKMRSGKIGEMEQRPITVRLDLGRSDAVVLFEWLMTVDLNAVPITHPAEKQALMDLLTCIEDETDVPGVTREQIDAARAEVARDMGW